MARTTLARLYSLALGKFQRAVRLDPKMHQAWNYLGYSHRKLGDYDASLEAYEQALALRPGYPEAIEYRAEAYLALKRFKDAEQSYLDLFGTNRAIADKLLDAMKSWIAAQHSARRGRRRDRRQRPRQVGAGAQPDRCPDGRA